MSLLQSIVLAIVEGLTEFLPVSSTGHLIVASSLLGIASNPFTKTFTIAVQFGAIFSVIVLYWKRFFQSIDFYLKLFVAFLPAAIIGWLLNDYIDSMLDRVDVVGFMLIAGGILFLFIDAIFAQTETDGNSEVTYPKALKIGFFQVIAVLAPGVSRSAATIIGGLAQRLNRKAAAEFSFFLAVPTLFAATAYKLFKFYKTEGGFTSDQISVLVVGNIVAFIIAIFAIRTFISFLTKNGFKMFGYYRIAIGLAILALYYSGFGLSTL
jgi:undecaprenyl-diphosphatase